jgi:SAM-dependent methyltransferase
VRKDLHEENRRSWNEATLAQNSHRGDQITFFRQGGSTLYPEEKELLGEIRGCSLLHLECNVGQDSLSLAQIGAHVTGVDISDTAITIARTLSTETGIPVTFYCMDLYDWLEVAIAQELQFDIVFCSYGTICWLSDLWVWAKGISTLLKPTGRFLVIDYHPMMLTLNEQQQRVFPYGTERNQCVSFTWKDGVSDFVAQAGFDLPGSTYYKGIQHFHNPHQAHEFYWGLGQIVTALLEAGLVLTALREYPYSNGYKPFDEMCCENRRWYLPDGQPPMPMMYAITAQKLG